MRQQVLMRLLREVLAKRVSKYSRLTLTGVTQAFRYVNRTNAALEGTPFESRINTM